MKLNCHVIHNGKDYLPGSECPKELEKIFLSHGFLVEEEVKKEAPKKEKKGN